MRLAGKLVLLFLVCLAFVVAVFSTLSIQQTHELALGEHERNATNLAATLKSALGDAPRAVSDIDQVLTAWSREMRYVQIRLVNPNAPKGTRLHPSVPHELIVSQTEILTITHPNHAGRNTMYTYVPLEDAAGSQLEVAAPESFWTDRLVGTLRRSAVALAAVSLATTFVILLGGLWMVGKPLGLLVDKVQRVGQGDLGGPVELKRADELGRLGIAINEMCDQLSRQRQEVAQETSKRIAAVEQLRHADRLRTVGRLAAGLAHEIGTPLNVVSGRAELIAGGHLSEEEIVRSAQAIKSQSERITQIVRQLLDFARRNPPAQVRVDLRSVIQETLDLLRPIADKQQIELELEATEVAAEARVDSSQIKQVLSNLVVNAIQASDPGKKIRVWLHGTQATPPEDVGPGTGKYWQIEISDQGTGIDAALIDQIFEPFFTTKDVGEGTGLGLSISYSIVREHAGWIAVQSQPGHGSTFSVYLPAAEHTT